jgi:dTDP-4-amino-4,6-dideoxygalactose transaminase
MCPSLLRYELQRPARAIIPVHLYGQPVQLDDIILAARQSGAAVIEDCAHAHGAFDNGLHAGLQGDIGCFSFYPTKPLGAAGDGGICITNSEQLAQRLRTLRMYGFDDRRICTEPGLNSRLDEIQAAILRQKLPRILSQQQHRQKLASLYLSQLQQIGIPTPAIRSSITHSWHQFVVRVPQRRLVQHRLAELGIGTAIHYEHCLHLMPAFSGQCTAGSYPFAEQAAAEVLSLPCSGHVTESDVEHIVEALAKCLP